MSDGDVVPSSAGNSGDPVLSVEHLSKRFGDRIEFADVSFDVGHGEVFGFLGPNGAGKTTMVRTLGTLLSPWAGTAIVVADLIAFDPRSSDRGTTTAGQKGDKG